MVLTERPQAATVRRVAAAAARSYAVRGDVVLEAPFEQVIRKHTRLHEDSELEAVAVVVPELQRIECVLDREADPAALLAGFEALSDLGWDLWALVPGPLLGEAHRAFRGHRVRIQPWWIEADHLVRFGATEIP
ncbi:MAG: hypothetical protein ACE5KX_06325 [Acidimicrobiia bacterium]